MESTIIQDGNRVSKLQKDKEKYLEQLGTIKVKCPVKDMKDATSDRVVSYSVTRLQEGCTYEELRRELGLGPASQDRKWRALRTMLCEYLLPKTEEEAMLQANSDAQFWMKKLEDMVDYLDERIKQCKEESQYFDEDKQEYMLAESSMLPTLLKTKADVVKSIVDHKKKFFGDFMEIQKLRKAEKSTHGKSVTIINYIPRPEQTIRDVGEHAKQVVIKAARTTNDRD